MYLSVMNGSYLKILDHIKSVLDNIEEENGTVVCIDKLDRFMGYDSSKVTKESNF